MMEKELRKRLKNIGFVCGLKVPSHIEDTYMNGAAGAIRLVEEWLRERGDGWHDLPDEVPTHNSYVHLIVENKDGTRRIVLAWFSRMLGQQRIENVWTTQRRKNLKKVGRKPIAWMERKLSPQIPERLQGGNPTDQQVALIQKLYGKGRSVYLIGSKLGFSVAVVEKAIKQEIS